jgi:hypothetical protein
MAPEGGQLADRDVLSDSWTVGKPTPVTLGRPAGSERLAVCSRRARFVPSFIRGYARRVSSSAMTTDRTTRPSSR